MPRPPDLEKRTQLMNKLVLHVQEHGLHYGSLQELSDGVEVSTRMLLHYFGSAENLRIQLFEELGKSFQQIFLGFKPEELKNPKEAIESIFQVTLSPNLEKVMRSFFELYGYSLQNQDTFGAFAKRSVDRHLDPLRLLVSSWGVSDNQIDVVATSILLCARGLSSDALATRDTDRVQKTLKWLVDALCGEIERCK